MLLQPISQLSPHLYHPQSSQLVWRRIWQKKKRAQNIKLIHAVCPFIIHIQWIQAELTELGARGHSKICNLNLSVRCGHSWERSQGCGGSDRAADYNKLSQKLEILTKLNPTQVSWSKSRWNSNMHVLTFSLNFIVSMFDRSQSKVVAQHFFLSIFSEQGDVSPLVFFMWLKTSRTTGLCDVLRWTYPQFGPWQSGQH